MIKRIRSCSTRTAKVLKQLACNIILCYCTVQIASDGKQFHALDPNHSLRLIHSFACPCQVREAHSTFHCYSLCVVLIKIYDSTGFIIVHPYYIGILSQCIHITQSDFHITYYTCYITKRTLISHRALHISQSAVLILHSAFFILHSATILYKSIVTVVESINVPYEYLDACPEKNQQRKRDDKIFWQPWNNLFMFCGKKIFN